MRVLFCASEIAPFAKVGGLADVVGSLPKALTQIEGIEPVLVMPRYGLIDPDAYGLVQTGIHFEVGYLDRRWPVSLWQGRLPGTEVPVWFVDNPDLISNRQEVYPYGNFDLEVKSFLLFGQAVLHLMRYFHDQGEAIDRVHLHDWHVASLAVKISQARTSEPWLNDVRTLLTIHNLAYQGVYGGVNWLREGLLHADFLTTVSPSYAREIQTPAFGEGLDDVLRARSDRLVGILNGLDTELFNPATDAFIPNHYTAGDWQAGKAACKVYLQRELGLPEAADVPLFGFVGRLVDQKGVDLLIPAIEALSERLGTGAFQVVMLGSGDPETEARLKRFNEQVPHIRSYIGFNLGLAQKIYAGTDCFLMPSRFEPCGLGQLIALRYGSIPVVRAVGGLIDTVTDANAYPGTGNGFCFDAYTPEALAGAMEAAMAACLQPEKKAGVVVRGMSADYSWNVSARRYAELYQGV